MSAYRFCRTDDVGLLVDALNRCWSPSFPADPVATPATFKRSIRDLQIWCSSCMVAFAGPDPIGVLIGGKRSTGTLIHRIAVHPDHQRQGHGHHLLRSLGSKLAILGPPRMIAEVPESLTAARELFNTSAYVEEARLTDYVMGPEGHDVRAGAFVIPVTVDDLAANGILGTTEKVCWERSVETLTARKDEIAGIGIASEEQIEAYVLYLDDGGDGAEIMALRSFVEDADARLAQLLARVRALGKTRLGFGKVHPAELSRERLQSLGFRATGEHLLYAATARSD